MLAQDRRPTAAQVKLITALRAGDRPERVTAPLQKLIDNGWVTEPDRGLALTALGDLRLDQEFDVAEYLALPVDQRPRVYVEPRTLGRSPIKGMRGPRPGRNVKCWDCYRVAKDQGTYADSVVWYTNESGAAAERDAEAARARHALRHARGELPTPVKVAP